MKVCIPIIALLLISPFFSSCNNETKDLKAELESLKQTNSALKAKNIALQKEIEELYKKIDEKNEIKQTVKDREEAISGNPSIVKESEKNRNETKKKQETDKTIH